MSARLIPALGILLVATASCAVSPDDAMDGDSLSTTSQAIWDTDQVPPTPLDRPKPAPEIPFRRPRGLPPIFGELERSGDFRRCVRYYLTIYDPGKEQPMEVPVTVCP
jgi:hypothetical protein